MLYLKQRHILQVFLVFGKSGWIGGLIGQLLKERGLKFEYANARLEDRTEVIADLERVSNFLTHLSSLLPGEM